MHRVTGRSRNRQQPQLAHGWPVFKCDHHSLRMPGKPREFEHNIELAELVRGFIDPLHVVQVAHPQLLADRRFQFWLGHIGEPGVLQLPQLRGLQIPFELVVRDDDREFGHRGNRLGHRAQRDLKIVIRLLHQHPLWLVRQENTEVHRLKTLQPEAEGRVVMEMQIVALGVRSVILMPKDDGVALLDCKVHEVHRHKGLRQACVGARDVTEIGVVRPQLVVDGCDVALREIVDVEDVAEAWMLEVEILGD